MLYLAVIAALELAVIAGALWLVKSSMDERAAAEQAWAAERGVLLNRIQRPDLVPSVQPVKPPSREEIEKRQRVQRELASVGTVTHINPNADR